MTKDRLTALIGSSSNNSLKFDTEDDDDEVAVNMTMMLGINDSNNDSSMQRLFTETDEIRRTIEHLQLNVERVKMKHSDILSTPQNDQRLRDELEDLTADIKRTANQVRAKLNLIEFSIERDDNIHECSSSADLRIRKTQHSSLSRQFVDVMSEYNRAQTDHRDRCKARIQRQLEIAGRTTTSEELEEMLEQGNPALFTRGIVVESQQARQSRADIEARHADIVKLENTIRELHDMFMDMVVLVESQGELVDRVEYHVAQTGDYVGVGKQGLGEAHKYRRKSKKKLVYLCVCLTVVAGVFLCTAFVY